MGINHKNKSKTKSQKLKITIIPKKHSFWIPSGYIQEKCLNKFCKPELLWHTLFLFFGFCFLTFNVVFSQSSSPIRKSDKIEVIDGRKYHIHTVEKGQTLYSIAKTYGSTVDIVLANNPEAVDGIKPFDKLKIPVINENTKKEIRIETNLVDTTTKQRKASIASDIKHIQHIVKDSESDLADIVPIPDTDIRVALFLPLQLSNTDKIDVHKISLGHENLNEELKTSIEFYEGIKMAFDSLRKQRFNGKLYIYDTYLDSIRFVKLMKKPELKQMDMFIGPLHGKQFENVLKYAKENKIPIVAPTIQSNNILLGNPIVSKVTPSYVSQTEALALYIAEKHAGNNILLFNSANSKDKPYLNTFKKIANPMLRKLNSDTVREVTFTTLKNFISKTKPNLIAITSTNQSFIAEAINKLFLLKQESKDSIIVFGLSNFLNIESLDFEYLNDLHLNISSYKFPDYSNPLTKEFIQKYRSQFGTEPTEYVFLGFDVGYYYLKALQMYGKSMQKKLPDFKHKGIQSEFNFYQSEPPSVLVPGSGYENKGIGIMKFENYSYVRVN